MFGYLDGTLIVNVDGIGGLWSLDTQIKQKFFSPNTLNSPMKVALNLATQLDVATMAMLLAKP